MTTLYDWLSKQAASLPSHLALASSTLEMSFTELKSAVDSTASKLTSLGVQPQQLILIELPEFYNWIVTLAASKIGAVSVSMPEKSYQGQFANLINFRVSMSNVESSKDLLFEVSWLSVEMDADDIPAYEFSDSDYVRAIATSGTTGMPKLVMFTQKSMEARLRRTPLVWSSQSTEFNFMPLGATGGFGSAIHALLSGFPYLVKDTVRKALVDFIARNKVTTITGSPEQISVFLSNNADHLDLLGAVKTIRLAGASPAKALIRTIKERLDVEIVSVYGSTETGSIFTNKNIGLDESLLLGVISEGSNARIVDDKGVEVGDGCEGFLETKSESMFSGYLRGIDPLTVEQAPEWFATTDRAIKTNGVFQFLGRDSNVLNIGGIKIEVEQLENFARSQQGVHDAVSFVGESSSGRALHVMAIVTETADAKSKLVNLINENFPDKAPRVFWNLDEIPRATLDKPARWLLAERFRNEYRG